ncbi:MAG: amidohydrolase family protein [Flavobacteriaceae bacterium]
MTDIYRREFLTSVAALAAAAVSLPSASGAASAAVPDVGEAAGALPERGEFVIRGATVLTMDDALGNIDNGAVHVRNGEIVAVGETVDAPAATIIDGTGSIVMPGLVDTHWHMWNTILRSFSGNSGKEGYFATSGRFGKLMMPQDILASSMLSAAEAINSGITTIYNWGHNARSRDHAEADILSMTASGLRGRYYFGWGQGHSDEEPIDFSAIEGLQKDWGRLDGGGMVTLGFGWRGMYRATGLPEAVYRADYEAARGLKLPMSVHVGSSQKAKGQVGQLADNKFLGPDMQIVHAISSTPEEIARVKDAGSAFAATPGSEMRIGFGLPKIGEYIAAGVPTGIGIDSVSLSGTANLFEIIRWARNVEKAKKLSEFDMPAIDALRLGTIDGARSVGIDDRVGSLTPGKRADLLMITTDALNMGVFTDAENMAVECTTPANVDTVVIDGRILKRGGKLVHLNRDAIVGNARVALAGIRERAAWR